MVHCNKREFDYNLKIQYNPLNKTLKAETMSAQNLQTHPFKPFYDEHSKVLILGSFPSPDSKKAGFYYQNKNNRFWAIMEHLFGENNLQGDISKQKDFLKAHKIALWDIVASCEIEGAKDESIKNATPNDLSKVLNKAQIRQIFITGAKAFKLACEFYPQHKDIMRPLPSSSGANRAHYPSVESLCEKYRQIKDFLS